MKFNNNRHLFVYLLSVGFMTYILTAMLSTVFIVPVKMDNGWCLEWKELEFKPDNYEKVCVEFKNSFEETKYFHNLQMMERNEKLYSFVYLFFLFSSIFVFYFIPKWTNGSYESFSLVFLNLLVLNFIAIYIVAQIIGYILPAPADWFPQIFTEIHEKMIDSTLEDLKYISDIEGE